VPKPLAGRLLGRAYRGVRARLARVHPARFLALGLWLGALVGMILARRRERRLTVAVDIRPLWEPLSGVGWYLDRLLRELALREDLSLRLYGPSLAEGEAVPPPVVPLPEGPTVELVTYPTPDNTVIPQGRLISLIRRLGPLLIAAERNRVVFAPNFYPPRRLEPAIEIGGAHLVATIHDLAFRHFSWSVREETLDLLERHLDRTFRLASCLVTPSEAVRREIVEAGLARPERIRAIHHGPGQLSAIEPTQRPEWAPRRYALFVGTLEPRKNVETLLEAWRRVRSVLDDPPDLVLCGKLGWKSEGLQRALAAGRNEGWLHHPGYVANEELSALYRNALFLAFPSHYEGFGLPVLEAFATGTPVIASDIPVLREVAGGAVLYAPPDSVDTWVARIVELLGSETLSRGLVTRGRERVGSFSWSSSAATHLDELRRAATSSGQLS